MMTVGLIDVDGHNYPNLALMKISAWHKAHGDSVDWYVPLIGSVRPYDMVYISKVFSFTQDYQYPIYAKEVKKGGSGYAIQTRDGRECYDKLSDTDLPYEVEHIYPDYGLYPEMTKDTAYGFLTRGCPRGCSFCHVGAKEGRKSRKVADLPEFWRGQKNIILCDPNILAAPEHMDLLEQLAESKATVDFNQGLDIRLLTERNLEWIRKIRIKRVHFAFDRWQDKELIEPRLRMFKEATGFDHRKVSVFILTNYDTSIKQDLYRIQLCRELDFSPYVMIYDKKNCDKIYKRMQRWCNPAIFWKVKDFNDYC